MSSSSKPAKSVTFGQAEVQIVSDAEEDAASLGPPPGFPQPGLRATMFPSGIQEKSQQGASSSSSPAAPDKTKKKKKKSAFEKAKLRLRIRTDGQGNLLCCPQWPCWQREACKQKTIQISDDEESS